MLSRGWIRGSAVWLAFPRASQLSVASDAERAEADAFTKSAAANSPLRLPVTNREDFFFRGGTTCRLCNETAEVPKLHFSEGVCARYHTMREVLVDLLIPYYRAGMPPEAVAATWPDRLLRMRHVPRVPPLVSGKSPLQRAAALHELLVMLRNMGIIEASVSPARRQFDTDATFTKRSRNVVDFERLEYIGDAMWGSTTKERIVAMFPGRDWMSPSSAWALGIIRDNVESNVNLTALFNTLNLGALLPKDVVLGGEKPQADIVESVMGELHEFVMSRRGQPLARGAASPDLGFSSTTEGVLELARHALAELCDLTVLQFFYTLLTPVKPIVQEFAAADALPPFLPPITGTPQQPPVWMISRRMRRLQPSFTFTAVKLHDERRHLDPSTRKSEPALERSASHHQVDVDAMVYHLDEAVCDATASKCTSPATRTDPLRGCPTPRAATVPVSVAAAKTLAMSSPPAMATEDERLLARMHPLNQPFVVNSGTVPAVVLAAERLSAEKARRKRLQHKRPLGL
jgi:hypothetical protein